MELFRISKAAYAKTLTASGRANRWNFDDQFLIYAGSSRSLATLELIVHRNSIVPRQAYQVMVISIADDDSLFTTIRTADLPKNWQNMSAYPELQRIGGDWYDSRTSLALKVPSAVIPQEYNVLINIHHPSFQDASKITLVRTEDYFWDNRLL